MTLKEKLQADLIQSMKDKNEVKVGALRMFKAAVMKWEVDGEKKVADDEVVEKIVQKEIKQRRDAAEGFRQGGNEAMAQKEEQEIEFLAVYMPVQMSEAEVTEIVKATLAETGLSSKADMGKVMGALMPKVKGKADGALVNKIVSSLLN